MFPEASLATTITDPLNQTLHLLVGAIDCDGNDPLFCAVCNARIHLRDHLMVLEADAHCLVIEEGDEESYGRCSCGHTLGRLRSDQSFDIFAESWQRHVMRR